MERERKRRGDKCKKGHLLVGDNIYQSIRYGVRCATCCREYQREAYKKKNPQCRRYEKRTA